MQPYTTFQNKALLIMRLIVATIFIYAAYAKLFFWSGTPEGMSSGMIMLMKFLSIVEPIGALALIIGWLTRWAATGLAIIMVGAIVVTQFVMQIGFATPTGPGWSFPLMILAGCLVLMAFGPGQWSIDASRSVPKLL